MIGRQPIHLGAGEPVLLLHPFMMSSYVWHDVAPALARTGRLGVFARRPPWPATTAARTPGRGS